MHSEAPFILKDLHFAYEKNKFRPQAQKYSQASRLHDLIRILEARFGATVDELVEECQVTRRTIYRDLQAIIDAGYPLISERQDDGHVLYSFMSGFSKMPPIVFSLEELMTLYLCRGQLDFLNGTPFQEDLDAVFSRIRSNLPPRSVAHLERLAEASSPKFLGYKDYSGHKQLLSDLRGALLKQQQCQVDYQPVGRTTTRYQVDPYTLLFYKNGLYIGGLAHNRGALRLFAVERIKNLVVSETRFDVPDDYTVDLLTGTAFGLIEETQSHKVELYFAAEVAPYVQERIWHPDQYLVEHDDGSVTLSLIASGDQELLAWIATFIPYVKIVKPDALRNKFVELLQEGLLFQGGV